MATGSSRDTYQRIYEDFQWYGDGQQGRSPGVRLIPHFIDWIQSPVLDMGCGRGHTVEALRERGLEATGIDQITMHPDMRVGDITQPIEDMEQYRSIICIDCIEHLTDEQVAGLFANMRRVERQAFSIHNGPATGTGEDLHINIKSFDVWLQIIEECFEVEKIVDLQEEQKLYLTSTRTS
jgi:SAM-dependent methyltransferase